MIWSARACPVPGDGLLQAYVGRDGVYTDCFEVMHPMDAGLEEFIAAFYTTWLFRMERAILTVSLRRRIRDRDVAALARSEADVFAAWRVEAREAGQILLCDLSRHTRSYLAVAPKEGGATRLIFGSAVVPKAGGGFPFWVNALMPFHRVYSKALLLQAEWKLRRG